MSWQKCPVCNGTGKEHNHELYQSSTSLNSPIVTCTVCKGHKIISELTGLPPSIGISIGTTTSATTCSRANSEISDYADSLNRIQTQPNKLN